MYKEGKPIESQDLRASQILQKKLSLQTGPMERNLLPLYEGFSHKKVYFKKMVTHLFFGVVQSQDDIVPFLWNVFT